MTRPHRRARAPLAAVAALAVAALLLVGCDAAEKVTPGAEDAEDTASSAADDLPEPVLRPNVEGGATGVPVDTVVRVKASHATLRDVKVTSGEGNVSGQVRSQGAVWVADGLLEPGTTYTIKTVAEAEDGSEVRKRSRFTTQDLSLDQQTFASVSPLDGETVGVGMPVVVQFDVPVTDQAAFEKKMTVSSTPQQPGTWHWVSSTEAHWRPKQYWKAGTEVTVDVDVNGVDAGKGIYGQESRSVDFAVGDAHIYKVNAQTHQMKVFENGELTRTFPITTGKQGFTTRSGTKVIMEKYESKRMNSETVGIPAGSAEAYDINNVQWAMRITSSGEFIHAAPWSVGSQGSANVSHGCTGMSTADAGRLYSMTRRGDVVEYTGTDRPMEPQNGWGDWNVSYADYRKGSALS